MKLSKSKYLNSISVTLELKPEVIEMIVFKYFKGIGILKDCYSEYRIDALSRHLITNYYFDFMMLDDLNDFINCVRNLEIIN